jgi:hypothetical protein
MSTTSTQTETRKEMNRTSSEGSRNAAESEEAAATSNYETRCDRKAVRDRLCVALNLPDRKADSNEVDPFENCTAEGVVDAIVTSDPVILKTWQSAASGFRDTCEDVVDSIISDLKGTVADIIDRFPEPTVASRELYRSVVNACESCCAIVTNLLDEHIHSPAYQGDKSWATMEEAVIAKAVAGDPAAQEYVERHGHLPEHPGKLWNGREWIDDPPWIPEYPGDDEPLEQYFYYDYLVCRQLEALMFSVAVTAWQ